MSEIRDLDRRKLLDLKNPTSLLKRQSEISLDSYQLFTRDQ
jgi:hypothetical protein